MFELKKLTGTHSYSEEYCYPDWGLDCHPDGECPPEDGSDDCSPYEA